MNEAMKEYTIRFQRIEGLQVVVQARNEQEAFELARNLPGDGCASEFVEYDYFEASDD